MSPDKSFASKNLLLILTCLTLSISVTHAQDGKAIFTSKCAQCHILGKDAVGPNLQGVIDRWDGDMNRLHAWVKNPPKVFAAGDAEAQKVVPAFGGAGVQMTPFEGVLTDADIEAVLKYASSWTPPVPKTPPPGEEQPGGNNALIFGIISLIMAIIALVLMQVNSNLKKLSDDKEGILRPEPVPFYKNKVYITLFSCVLFVVGGYYVTRGAIDFGRQKKYQPKQPIFYSHKVHAGVDQINCLYCHGAAWDSRHAAIPSVNVCMNCHKTINTYEKGPKLFDDNGNEINANAELQKLFEYAGFDPKNPSAWDASKAKAIPWIRIHSLPDHVYFNHSQHIRAGKVQCQTCHGEITNMNEVYQFSELSMGWCINCHRNTKVDFYDADKGTGNKFYSIYEKFHNDIKNGKMDSVTVKDIGGIECQKCHY